MNYRDGLLYDVISFHLACGIPMLDKPALPAGERQELRARLINEEVNNELLPAIQSGDLVGIADGIADSMYILLGTALEYGIPFEEVWKRIHFSNLKKASGPKREDGKQLKPDGWTSPDIRGALIDAGWVPPKSSHIDSSLCNCVAKTGLHDFGCNVFKKGK